MHVRLKPQKQKPEKHKPEKRKKSRKKKKKKKKAICIRKVTDEVTRNDYNVVIDK